MESIGLIVESLKIPVASLVLVCAVIGCSEKIEPEVPVNGEKASSPTAPASSPKASISLAEASLQAAVDKAMEDFESNPTLPEDQQVKEFQEYRAEVEAKLRAELNAPTPLPDGNINTKPQTAQLTCADVKQRSIVSTILLEELVKNVWFNEMKPNLVMGGVEKIKTVGVEGSSKTICDGSISYEYKGKARSDEIRYSLTLLEDSGQIEVSVSSESINQLTAGLMTAAIMGR